jgi:hypothetical protein
MESLSSQDLTKGRGFRNGWKQARRPSPVARRNVKDVADLTVRLFRLRTGTNLGGEAHAVRIDERRATGDERLS